jgi:two-component system KDP operon response regulator KdpE
VSEREGGQRERGATTPVRPEGWVARTGQPNRRDERAQRVLVVEDEPQLLRAMRITLQARGYEVRTATTGRKALADAAAAHPDIVVLDLGLPDLDGVEVIGGLRGWTSVPIIVLSGRTSGADKVAALDAGADDYVTKPFGVAELLARMRAVTRRSTAAEEASATVDIGDYRVELAGKRVYRRPEADAAASADEYTSDPPVNELHLTPTEWRLLEAVVRHPGKLVSQRRLITEVWGQAYTDDTSSLRLYVNRLRRKLEPEPSRPRHLLTEPGMGYRFQP